MNNELKPCPFCGGEAAVFQVATGHYQIECKTCPANVGRKWYSKEADVIEAWNRRTTYE